MSNDQHDERGRFATKGGAATGDPSKENAQTRTVPGHGTLPRSKPVAMHNHAPSVGTSSGGGGGGGGGRGGGGGGGGGSGGGSGSGGGGMGAMKKKLKSAKDETIALHKQIDERHMPTRTDAQVAAMTNQGGPQGSLTATPGKFRYQAPRRH